MQENEKQHNRDVKDIQKQVISFYSQKKKVRIYHGTTNSTRAVTFKEGTFVDVSRLDRIIAINTKEKYVLVEPNVPMDILVRETIKYGLVPPVVPELAGITVGGAVQGGAEESSSFQWGMMHDNCLEYEAILGNGDLIIASPDKNPDFFWGTAASYGSLGIVTLIKLRLIPAKDFIHVTYNTVRSFEEAVSLVRKKASEAVTFIDGIMFSKDFGVIMTGNFSDKRALPISTFSRAIDEWFYLHAKKISQKHAIYDELIPVKDYLFRYDRGAFWMGRYGFKVIKTPFNRVTRFIFNGICNTRALYRFFHETGLSQKYFVQDFNIPSNNAVEFLKYTDKELNIYPLWICPLKPGKLDKLSANCIQTDLVFNIGIWGEANKDFSEFVKINRDFEKKSFALGGRKMLYAHQYYDSDQFWEVYDFDWYASLREKYHANDIFPTIYEKTKVSERYDPAILKGILHYIKSPSKLRIS